MPVRRLSWCCLLAVLMTANLLWLSQTGHYLAPRGPGLRGQASSMARVVRREAATLPQDLDQPAAERGSLGQREIRPGRDRPDDCALLEEEAAEAGEGGEAPGPRPARPRSGGRA